MRIALLLLLVASQALAQGYRQRVRCPGDGGTTPPANAPLLKITNPAVGSSYTFPRKADGGALAAWCATLKLQAQKDWVLTTGSTQGLLALGTSAALEYNSPYTVWLDFYTSANTLQSVFRQNDASGNQFAGFSTLPNPIFRAANHVVSLCYANGTFTMWRDGAKLSQSASGAVIPATINTIRVGDIGAGTFVLEQVPTELCVSGPSSTPTGTDPTTAVTPACGEFTVVSAGPCYGCVTPAAGAAKVLALGDSITSGAQLGYPRTYPNKLNALLGTTYAVTNGGADGYTVAQVRTRYQALYKSGGYQHVAVLAGINDIGRDGATGAATWTAMEGLLDELRSDGAAVKVSKLVGFAGAANPTWWTAAKQTEADAFNASLEAYCTAHAAQVKCVDPGTLSTGSPPAIKAQYDSGDGLHPNQAGVDELAARFAAQF
jgi:lysophospholipase L1-like esterase